MHSSTILQPTYHMDFESPEALAQAARSVQEKMLEQGLPVPAISQVMLGLTRGRYLEYLDIETQKSSGN